MSYYIKIVVPLPHFEIEKNIFSFNSEYLNSIQISNIIKSLCKTLPHNLQQSKVSSHLFTHSRPQKKQSCAQKVARNQAKPSHRLSEMLTLNKDHKT